MKHNGVVKFKPHDIERIISDCYSQDEGYHYNNTVKRGTIAIQFTKNSRNNTIIPTGSNVSYSFSKKKRDNVQVVLDDLINRKKSYSDHSSIVDKLSQRLNSDLNIAVERDSKPYPSRREWSLKVEDVDNINPYSLFNQWEKKLKSVPCIFRLKNYDTDNSRIVFEEILPTSQSLEFLENKECKLIQELFSVAVYVNDNDLEDKTVLEDIPGESHTDKVLRYARNIMRTREYQEFKDEFLKSDLYSDPDAKSPKDYRQRIHRIERRDVKQELRELSGEVSSDNE